MLLIRPPRSFSTSTYYRRLTEGESAVRPFVERIITVASGGVRERRGERPSADARRGPGMSLQDRDVVPSFSINARASVADRARCSYSASRLGFRKGGHR